MSALAGRTLPELLRHQVQQRGERVVYTHLADGEQERDSLTFAQLDRDARAFAASIERQLALGDRALILAVDGLHFIRAFLGCQYAGVIAVPASLPFPVRSPAAIRTLQAIVTDCGARAVLSDAPSELAELICGAAPELAALPWLSPGEVARGGPTSDEDGAAPAVDVRPEDVSFLQYTSGSTSLPKGVVVTHEALLHNEALIAHWMSVTADDVFVVWLPLFHDMGLIGNVLQMLYSGAQSVLMPPLAFVQRPERWLRAISCHRGTISGGPNFGYELCTRRVREEDCEGLDLSSWRWAYNGAEPVRSATLSGFARRFRRFGFDRRALAPCYGLAESTLLVAGTARRYGVREMAICEDALTGDRLQPGEGRTLVASGVAMLHRRIEIVDPLTSRRLPEGRVGEIWVAGPDLASGYWGRPQESEHTFKAHLADGDDERFLRTGDLGALHDGHLFVTGRLKDLIIVAGRNHYPQDVEATVEEADPAVRRGCCAAFAVELEGQEGVVILVEVRADACERGVDLAKLRRSIRSAVARDHEIALADVALVAAHSVPKTSSGKLQRAACRKAFLAGQLPPAAPAGQLLAAAPHALEEPA